MRLTNFFESIFSTTVLNTLELTMVERIEKRRKPDSSATESKQTSAPRASRIFSPFRVLGYVTNETPIAIGTLGSTFYVVTSVGRSFQIYDVATLRLLFISEAQTASKITSLAASHHYVFAGYGNKIGIYKRGKLQHTLECDVQGSITRMVVMGTYLVASTEEGEIIVFKKPSGSKLPTEFYTALTSINTSIDGSIVGLIHPPTYLNKIVVATTEKIFIFNVKTRKLVYESPTDQFGEKISCIEPAPALDIIAIGTSSGGVYLYHLRKGKIVGNKIVASASEVPAKVTSLSFRTDGSSHLVASLSNGDMYFHDLNRKARIHILRNVHKEMHGGVASAKFLNGQPIVITNGGDNQLKEFVFDPTISTSNSAVVSPPRHLRSRGGHSAPPTAIEFPGEDKTHYLYSASRDRSFWSFSLRKDAQAQELSQRMPKRSDGKRQSGQILSLKEKFPEISYISSSQVRAGEWENIITCHNSETFARTWDSKNLRVGRHVLPTVDEGLVKTVCVSHCGNFGFVGSGNGGIGVYNLQSGILRKKYMLHKKAVTGLAIDGMNSKMVSCGLDGILGFYDFSKSKYLGKLDLEAPITKMIYCKASDLIACALDDLSIVVVDVVTQKPIRILYGHSNRITGLDFSPDGRWIVSVALDSTLRTWDIPTGLCIDGVRLPSVATNVKFSPIGDLLATTHVSGNGIFLWTNRSQFKPISIRQVEEEEFSNILLPDASSSSGATMLDGAFVESDDEEEDFSQIYESKDIIDESLVTMSSGPREKFNTLLHLDIIKQRNKPKEAPEKPKSAPFFLSLSGDIVGDRAVEAESGEAAKTASKFESEDISTHESKLHKLKPDSHVSFESDFTKSLRLGAETGDYSDFLHLLVHMSPSSTDLEIRSLNSFPPLTEMSNFISALIQGLRSNRDYDLYQAIFSMFLKAHGDVVYNNPDDIELSKSLNSWAEINAKGSENLDEVLKYCSGVISFLSTV